MQKIILFVFFCMVFILLEGRFLRMPMRGRPMPRRPPRPSTRLSNHHIDSPFRMRGENFIARLKANPQQTITTIASTGAGLAALIDLLLELFGNEETTDLMDQFFPIILTTKRHEMSIPKSDFYEEAIFEKMEILMEKKIDEFCFLDYAGNTKGVKRDSDQYGSILATSVANKNMVEIIEC